MKIGTLALGFAVMVVAASCAKTAAQTNSLESASSRIQMAALDNLQLDKKLNISKNFGATIELDQAGKMATLLIKTCPPGAKCFTAGPRFSAKIISTKAGECGAKVITARTDARPVDGALTEIIVTDNSHPSASCPTGKKAVTVVVLNTSIVSRSSGQASDTHSVLSGQVAIK